MAYSNSFFLVDINLANSERTKHDKS